MAAARHFTRRIAGVREALREAVDFDAAAQAVLALSATWTPDALAALFVQAMQLAALEGREAAFADGDDLLFAEPDFTRQEFREQIDFLTQKRGMPTQAWTEAMRSDHDRAFVVAGVTDMAMLEEFQQAIIEGAKTYDIKAFAGEFDRIVEKYGWSYNGGRNWRIRTIFETNIRTSYMAGRLRQMRDPDMVKIRPYWQYRHGETRVPLNPRPEHEAWHDLVLMWNDPWWDVHFPPNDWACSCGVRTLSRGDLRRMGKSGPDQAPKIVLRKHLDKTTGLVTNLPEGIGYGWDYMPGDTWQSAFRRELIEPAELGNTTSRRDQATATPKVISVDTPDSIEALRARAKPFSATLLPPDLDPEDYAKAFLEKFGLEPGTSKLWTDVSGARILIADDLFKDPSGAWKSVKRGHSDHVLLLAETLMDPDEIWLSLRAIPDPEHPGEFLYEVVRRYVRIDPERPVFALFDLGRKIWFQVTGYGPQNQPHPDFANIHLQRNGKLIWKRK
ncbi:phage Mu protein F like protein [Rhodobacter aestuarii]|uniref:Phage Mu protein F like protein n=1 Tax=Rhodobacter aestuarii TaxID=453582 RepID=A0A1N7Q1R6_9RHOB|nr:PBECR2 nuclease fold domain-containing protein [Rhodobacter aestuarii]PTV94029.1 phage Mu protein F like protein [Rhodobacter aestuarii]SIT16761.1 Phage Mu protein F like protein [Rhodobacter aestuarii]